MAERRLASMNFELQIAPVCKKISSVNVHWGQLAEICIGACQTSSMQNAHDASSVMPHASCPAHDAPSMINDASSIVQDARRIVQHVTFRHVSSFMQHSSHVLGPQAGNPSPPAEPVQNNPQLAQTATYGTCCHVNPCTCFTIETNNTCFLCQHGKYCW